MTRAKSEIEEMLRALVCAFVFHPTDLELWVTEYPGMINVRMRAHAEDTSRLIGDEGNMFRSLCKLAQAIGKRHGMRVTFASVEQPVVGEAKPYSKFIAKPDWPRVEILADVERVSKQIFRPEAVRITDHVISKEETLLEVHVSQREDTQLVQRVNDALLCVFNAIGRKNGRLLSVIVIPDVPSDDSDQPARADGRHVTEIKTRP